MTEPRIISPGELEAAARALISAKQTNLGVEVQMPVIYPTGESVTVVVNVEGGEYVVHDAGFGAMTLTTAGIAMNHQLRLRLADLAKHYGCEFIEGRMSRRCTPEKIALAMVLVANASRTVGDQAIEAKKRPLVRFRKEIVDVVSQVYGERVLLESPVTSDDGKVYRVDAVVMDADRMSPVAFVEAVTDEQAVNRHFREFFDLKRSSRYGAVHRVAIFDNRRKWPPGELSILSEVSEPVPYSEASNRLQKIAA